MQPIPRDIVAHFEAVLKKRAVPVANHANYRKWLRYYLDFRSRYSLPDSRSEHVRLFIDKLRQKNQTPDQQKQAAHALSLFFESQSQKNVVSTGKAQPHGRVMPEPTKSHQSASSPTRQAVRMPSVPAVSFQPFVSPLSASNRYNDWRCLKEPSSPKWDKLISDLAAQIKTRNYSRKSLKPYADWSRHFQGYLRNSASSPVLGALFIERDRQRFPLESDTFHAWQESVRYRKKLKP